MTYKLKLLDDQRFDGFLFFDGDMTIVAHIRVNGEDPRMKAELEKYNANLSKEDAGK